MKKQHHFRLLFCLLFLGGFWGGCLEKIDLDIPRENQDNLSVQGRIVQGNPSVIEVGIKKIFDFTGIQSFVKVQNVTIIDESGNELEIPQTSQGNYRLEIEPGNPDFEIKTGKSYKLRVLTFAGQLFESTYEPLLAVPKATDAIAEHIQEPFEAVPGEVEMVDKIRFSLTTPIVVPGDTEKARLLWEFEETYKITDSPIEFGVESKTCYVTQDIGVTDVYLLNGNDLSGDMVTNFPVFKRNISSQFAQGYYLTIYQQSLSKDAWEYWFEVQQSLNRDGNMFEPPVGKIRSNMVNVNDPEEDVFGYFYTTTQDTIRVYVSPETAGNPVQLCPPNVPPPPGGGCPVFICCDCLDAEKSTTVKPEWWAF